MPKNNKAKGSSFERRLCVILSRWLTGGDRDDLFSRNVLSGGRFTLAFRKGKPLGQPGDIIASDPKAFIFTEHFMVEAKHWKSLKFEQFLTMPLDRSEIGRVFLRAKTDAENIGLEPIVVAKQNFFGEVMMVQGVTARCLDGALPGRGAMSFNWHTFHDAKIWMLPLDRLTLADPQKFLKLVGNVRKR